MGKSRLSRLPTRFYPLHLAHGQVVLDAACRADPERFVRKPPQPPELPSEAWINRPSSEGKTP
jgi:hypothetical protein